MAITRLKLNDFTAFGALDLEPSPGLNIFVGDNGLGKTHLLKLLYAACDASRGQRQFPDKLQRVFLPSEGALGRLVRRGRPEARVEVHAGAKRLVCALSSEFNGVSDPQPAVTGSEAWAREHIPAVYIPVKEMLAYAPGFRSLYSQREIHFEEVYFDILDRAFLPALREPIQAWKVKLLHKLRAALGGDISAKSEEFYLESEQGSFEFSLVAEGMRKLALLYLLLKNGSLERGSVLFWDEPETNLNPKQFSLVADLLLKLQRAGVQIFISTHDYAILKELELEVQEGDQLSYFTLYRSSDSPEIAMERSSRAFSMEHSPITESMTELYDREIRRSFGGIPA